MCRSTELVPTLIRQRFEDSQTVTVEIPLSELSCCIPTEVSANVGEWTVYFHLVEVGEGKALYSKIGRDKSC